MPTVNEKLSVEAVRRKIMLLRYGNNEAQELIDVLRQGNPKITAAIIEGLDGVSANNATPARLRALRNLVSAQANAVYADIYTKLNSDLAAFGPAEVSYNATLLRNTIPSAVLRALGTDIQATTWQQVLSTVSSRAVMGNTINQWFNAKLPEQLTTSLVNSVQAGIIQGTPSTKIVADVRKGAVWGNHERNLATVTHTAINFVAADARELTRKVNSSLIKQRQWLSTLDNRTSTLCIVRDGLLYTADTPPQPIGHDIPYGAGPGKLHFRCRSTETWVIKSFSELGIDIDELDAGTRASMNGQVPAGMNYIQWLQEKASPRVQEEVLGVTRADMLRNGTYKASDFYDDGKLIPLSTLLSLDKRDGV